MNEFKTEVKCGECGESKTPTPSEMGWLDHIKPLQPRSPLENVASKMAWDAAVEWMLVKGAEDRE